ncbi:3-carboxy-cis,cis-muconate cycloisomerase [Nitratireductor sp. L1-7-SE]|uniref:3-carboxy-cis,cis-muconate cycloisomerase n=1 Tax=Nitratireductor rhodophyticola TaxID=2854036 RepID=A0ABS7R8P6_9HYPH|nr:3-carboxy-cis,cis-muconate cycloisomerase [Nitratireductor rhodophyticola]MBY8915833.1 3-carboxy-cis,cis-muconate cycloisomerase [Nitratireductor rhodophyticola]MBY8919098.1 3-carboxy-cis,cis-muconate cycloisomerase [Nitratireductor rhodophyticola]
MTISAFDHPILSGLLGDEELAPLFSARAEIKAMLRFEAELALAEADENVIPREAAREIATSLDTFSPDITALKAGVTRDGVVIPALVSQIRVTLSEATRPHLHFGATSQDVIDTGFALRAREAVEILGKRLGGLIQSLEALEERDGQIDVMAHTRMQAAIPVPAARKIRSWRGPLMRHTKKLAAVREEAAVLHFGGAAGTLDRLGEKGEPVAGRLAARLGLALPGHPRHSERDGIVAFASVLSLITGSLGKMGQDIALAAQSEIGEIELAAGGGSSAMPHKKNPVAAEALVTLARFNAALVGGMHQALVHENERSGAAWALEWMLLPQMIVATGAATLRAADLVDGLAFKARNA